MKEQLSVGQALAQAFALLQSGRSGEARRLARSLEATRPEPMGLPYLQGLLALEEGQGRKAAQHLTRALRQSPGAVPPLMAMARAQLAQNRLDEAARIYRALAVAMPDSAEIWREWADLLLAQARWMAASPTLHHAARLSPERAALHNNLGIARRATGDRALATDCFPRGHSARSRFCQSLCQSGRRAAPGPDLGGPCNAPRSDRRPLPP